MKLVIKIGTNAIFDQTHQQINTDFVAGIAKDVHALLQSGNEVIIVTSGAVGSGKGIIGGNGELGLKQAQAAVGQPLLMETYRRQFESLDLHVAQFLLTADDLLDAAKLQNILETYRHLVGKAVPIVNENDTTITKELSFGDNDALAAQVLLGLNFDTLIIFTEHGALIRDGKPLLESHSFDPKDYDAIKITHHGFGGLSSKLDSAKRAVTSGKKVIIAKAGDRINDLLNKRAIATHFTSRQGQ